MTVRGRLKRSSVTLREEEVKGFRTKRLEQYWTHTMETVTEGRRKLHIEGLYLYFFLPNIWGDQIKYDYMDRTRNMRLRMKESGQYLSENTER